MELAGQMGIVTLKSGCGLVWAAQGTLGEETAFCLLAGCCSESCAAVSKHGLAASAKLLGFW